MNCNRPMRPLNSLMSFIGQYGPDFDWVYFNPWRLNQRRKTKHTLLWVHLQLRFSWSNRASGCPSRVLDFDVHLQFVGGGMHHIVKDCSQRPYELLPQFETERHYYYYVCPPRCCEWRLFLIFFRELDLVVARETIHNGEHLMTCSVVNQKVHVW